MGRHGGEKQEYKKTGIQEYKKRYTGMKVCRYAKEQFKAWHKK